MFWEFIILVWFSEGTVGQVWWHTLPTLPELWMQSQEDYTKVKTSLGYIVLGQPGIYAISKLKKQTKKQKQKKASKLKGKWSKRETNGGMNYLALKKTL